MPSLKLSMALAPSSLLLFLVSSSVWVALSLPSPVAPADGQAGGEQCPPFSCGDVTISFPFGLIPKGAEQTNCGAGIGFQVRCYNNIPYLGSFQSEHDMQILSIFYHNHSLLIADRHWPAYFTRSSPEGCHIPTANTSSHPAPPFSVSPVNQNLIFYNCTKPPPPGAGLVETVCHNNTFVRAVDGRPDESAGSYFLEDCNATMVPVLGVSGKVNATNYEQLVRDGFLATWQWPPPPGNFALGTSIIPSLSIYQLSRKRNTSFGLYIYISFESGLTYRSERSSYPS